LIELSTAGDTEIQAASSIGFDWDPASERLVAWDDGADVYVLTPPAGDWRTEAWVWTRVPPAAGNTVVPSRNMNGTYGRFRYASNINAFVLVSSTDGPVWAYRLPADACQGGADCTSPPPCRTASGATCSGGLCVYPAADDGSACADDGNPCTDDVCRSGQCAHPGRAGAACDDGDACTTPDACDGTGNCVPGPDSCSVCTDADGDGYGDPAATACTHPELDCNDADADIHPGATEACSDFRDNDCDQLVDEMDTVDCGTSESLDGGCGCGSARLGNTVWLVAAGLLLLRRLGRRGRSAPL
jgi:hypothetical protein